jgi:LAO/AO transport system kinase
LSKISAVPLPPETDRLALARLLTQVENGTPAGSQALSDLFPRTGRAHLVGITGAPGTGKSSLVNQLALHVRRPPVGTDSRTVAVVAVDPSSPFTGGAVLGDRVRMRDLAGDPGVFIRSMASRGALGGLAHATAAVVQVLDAAGFELILIETVGVGQDEVDIARLAHTTLVVEAPGAGDDIQAIKAGILEIADILVLNKADRPGVENTERALRGMLEMSPGYRRKASTHHRPADPSAAPAVNPPPAPPDAAPAAWQVPLLRTVALTGAGIPELARAVDAHRAHLRSSGEMQHREAARLQAQLDALITDTLTDRFHASLPKGAYQQALEALQRRQLSPQQAVQQLLGE